MNRINVIRRFVLPAYVVALLVLMFVPVPATPSYLPGDFDKIVHVGLFFVLAVLAYWGGMGERSPTLTTVVAACAALAAAIEVVQSQIPYRSGDPKDFLAGTLGALAGALAARLVTGRTARR
jgi:VanZ family protein